MAAEVSSPDVVLTPRDALVIIDVQNDFVTGSLAVRGAGAIVPVLNRYIARFVAQRLHVFATRDWHPPDHCSFREQGGSWPPHCVAGTPGAAFVAGLALPAGSLVVDKAAARDDDTYSNFDRTPLGVQLRALGIQRMFVGGIATDYCVRATVLDAINFGFQVRLLTDAIGAVDVKHGDGAGAEAEMERAGAIRTVLADLAAESVAA